MTPEQIEKAQEVLDYAKGLLADLELKHQADPAAIFTELLTRLLEAQFQVQTLKGQIGELSEVHADRANETAADYREHDEVLAAVWEGDPPEGIDHQATLELIAALHKRPGAVALASETDPEPETEPKKAPAKKPATRRKASKPNERRTRKAAAAKLTGPKPAGK